jgi:diguanylate cyclase (GGDEF)-like protein
MADPVKPALVMPGSRYAAELGKGAADMRFPAELEREYQRFYLAERRSHVRFFNAVVCALVVLALLASLISGHENTGVLQYLRLGAIAAAYLLMAWIARSQYFERAYLKTAYLASLFIALVAGVEVATWIAAGVGEMFALLTLHSLGLYFLAGILFRGALQANLVMVSSLSASLIALDVPPTKVAYLTGILAGAAAIGGLAFRHQGIRFRRTFLEHGLVSEMAARDGLTGLKNRRAFDEHLRRSWQQALRDRRSLAVMMIDVDHFKAFNDRYGHQAGDDALQRVAAVVDGFAQRPLDLAARYGGEELAVILFDITRDHADKIAEQLRAAVQALGIEHVDSRESVAVTVSVGVAIVRPKLDRSPEGVVQLADEALYAAKKDGRNRVRVFESEYAALSTGKFKRE